MHGGIDQHSITESERRLSSYVLGFKQFSVGLISPKVIEIAMAVNIIYYSKSTAEVA